MSMANVTKTTRIQAIAELQKRKTEIQNRLQNGQSQDSTTIGGNSFTEDEWKKIIQKMDEYLTEVKQEQKERFEKRDKEKEIQLALAMNENEKAAKPKPQNIIEKMVMGRIGKYYEENCLLQQAFVKENKVSVEKHIAEVAKQLGGTITVKAFTRFETGEGIEKKEDDFAAEVASMIK